MLDQDRKQNIEQQLTSLPNEPGVYLMKDESETIIYVGKAKSLKKRVTSYFRSGTHTQKTILLTERVHTIEWITTGTEVEALMFESNLIKKHQPRFNIILKDDKQFPFLCLTITEDFPRLLKVRRVKGEGSLYFGPYIPEGDANRTIALIKKLFPLRRCSGEVSHKQRPCLHYEMGQCLSPCTAKIDKASYQNMVKEVKLFLDGRMEELLHQLEENMYKSAQELNFEEAGRLRDRIKAVKNSFRKQRIIATTIENRDIIGFSRSEDVVIIEQFFVRQGRLLGRKHYVLDGQEETPEKILRSFLLQRYGQEIMVPAEIITPFKPDDHDLLCQWLTERARHKVTLRIPQRGDKKSLLDMVQKNADLMLLDTLKNKQASRSVTLMKELADFLGLEGVPNRIEAFDISNIGGVMAVGSLVVWQGGGFDRHEYRHYKINTVSGSNDVKMMEEIVERRFQKILLEDKDTPDIVLLDGGRAQVNIVDRLFYDMGIQNVTIVGLAKGRSSKKLPRAKRPVEPEYLVFPHSQTHESGPKTAPENVLLFFQRIRDEAHRFAIEYHRKLREKLNFKSILDEIPGVGPTRKKKLFNHFGSLQKILNATELELASVRNIDRKTARTMVSFFSSLRSDKERK